VSGENRVSIINKVREHLARVAELRALPFDNPNYDAWRVETGRTLARVFSDLGSEKHPCVEAFLAYKIPNHFTANRDQMQGFYMNILGYQASLLSMYIEDLQIAESENKSN
jgi:hypothetical protein